MLLVISISCFACSDPCDVSGARRRRRGRGMAARGMNRTRAVAKASLPAPVAKAAAKVGQVATAVAASAVLVAGQAQAASLTFKEQQGLTYMQIKGTGLANTCPLLDDASDKVDVPAGEYQIEKFCLEPTGIEVREEAGGDFTPTKLMTRLTYTLDEISGKLRSAGATRSPSRRRTGSTTPPPRCSSPGASACPSCSPSRTSTPRATSRASPGTSTCPPTAGPPSWTPRAGAGPPATRPRPGSSRPTRTRWRLRTSSPPPCSRATLS